MADSSSSTPDLPILCENCLGDNPYVRILKRERGMECNVCGRVETQYRWKAGRKGRMKHTVVCRVCARLKNVCQSCVKDLVYGLPVRVRDEIIAKHLGTGSGAVGSDGGVGVGLQAPKTSKGALMFAASAEQRLALTDSTSTPSSSIPAAAHAELEQLARREPHYEGNKPKLCSFFLRGTCTRGTSCPYSHDIPADYWDRKEFYHKDVRGSIRDRFFGKDEEDGKAILERHEERVKKLGGGGAGGAGRREVIVGGDVASVGDEELKGALWSYGEVERVERGGGEAMGGEGGVVVEFKTEQGAVKAMQLTLGKLLISGKKITLRWKKRTGLLGDVTGEEMSAGGAGSGAGGVAGSVWIPPPPPLPPSSHIPPPPPPPPSHHLSTTTTTTSSTSHYAPGAAPKARIGARREGRKGARATRAAYSTMQPGRYGGGGGE